MNRWLLNLLLLLALAVFAYACFAPLFTLSKFYIFDNTVSLMSALSELWLQKQFALFAIIAVFSVLFPLVKIGLLLYLQFSTRLSQARHEKLIRGLDLVGKWSMLDVFIVAVMLVAIKLGPLANVTVHYGVYLFSAAIILMMLLSGFVARKSSAHSG